MPVRDLGQQRDQEEILLNATAQGDLDVVQVPLTADVDANSINEAGRTALIVSA